MGSLSISQKVLLPFVAVALMLLLAAGALIYQTQQVVHAVERSAAIADTWGVISTYRSAAKEARTAMMALTQSGDLAYLDAHAAAVAEARERRSALNAGVGAVDHTALAAADTAFETWLADIATRQRAFIDDPATVDIARFLETSQENTAHWEAMQAGFATIVNGLLEAQANAGASQVTNLTIMRLLIGLTCVIVLVVTVAVVVFVRKTVAAPLLNLAKVTEALSERNWSVAIPPANARDEVGRMSRALKVFRDDGLAYENAEAERREEAAKQVARARKVQKAVASFRKDASTLLGELDGAGGRLGDAANTLGAVSSTSHDFTRDVSRAANATGESVQHVAAAIDQMSSSVKEISGQVQSVSTLSHETYRSSQEAVERVNGLKSLSERIHEVIGLINGIAGQIDLLALNATIEAARAGEAGKGFAVVAQQVKQLSDRTSKATEDITGVIDEITSEVGNVVDIITNIGASIDGVKASSATVAAAVEQQSSAIDEIAHNVNAVSTETTHVAENVVKVETKVGETRDVADRVNALSEGVKTCGQALGGAIDTFIGSVSADRAKARSA